MEVMELVKLISNYGLAVAVFVMWHQGTKQTREILEQYKEDMAEQRRMYADNVELVKSYKDLAGDLREVVIMNTTAMTKTCDAITANQFCPMVRVETGGKQ